MYQSALELSDPFDIVENMPRRCGWQTTGANHPATTPKQYWKVSLFFAFIDHMIRQLESLQVIRKSLLCAVSASSCCRKYPAQTNKSQYISMSETYETDLACNFDEFNWEVARCQTRTLVYNISRVLPCHDGPEIFQSRYYVYNWKQMYDQQWTTKVT